MKIIFAFMVLFAVVAAALTEDVDDATERCIEGCRNTPFDLVCGKKGIFTIQYPNLCLLDCARATLLHKGRCP